MRQSAKAKNIQEAENTLLQNDYYESQSVLADQAAEDMSLIQGMNDLTIKYISRKMPR